jgi:hypothetical protein
MRSARDTLAVAEFKVRQHRSRSRGLKILLWIVVVPVGLVAIAVTAAVLRGFLYRVSVRRAGWNIRHDGLHVIRYSELLGSKVEEIVIDGEMVHGTPHHVLYVPAAPEWDQRYPDWARGRRDEIVRRIRSKCPDSEYSYHYKA